MTDQTSENYNALVIGDVSAPYVESSANLSAPSAEKDGKARRETEDVFASQVERTRKRRPLSKRQ